MLPGLALLTGLATLALAVLSLRSGGALRGLRAALFRAEVIESEALRLHRVERQLAEAQRLSEAVVAGGTGGVRALHRGIAAIPFGVLEAIPVTRDVTRIVRASHDLISDAVYGTLDAVNRGVGAGLRGALTPRTRSEAVDEAAPDPDPPPDPDRPALK